MKTVYTSDGRHLGKLADVFGDPTRQRFFYTWLDEGERAESCTACGECEAKCPQGIAVSGWMEKAQAFLAG